MNKYIIKYKVGDSTVGADTYVIGDKFVTFYKDNKTILEAKVDEIIEIWNIS
jgi:hypothetical protein